MTNAPKPNFAIPLLPSSSIKETIAFYTSIGAIITYQQKAPNNYVGFKIKDIEIHFFGLKQLKPEANFSTSYLIVDDIDTFYNLCREGLKNLLGKIPSKGIPRINQIKDMPTYGVRQFIMVDPSGNYIRIGQPIPKTASVLFEENGQKPQPGTALQKAYELADRLLNGKDDVEAATKVLDKVLAEGTNEQEAATLFKIITLRLEIAQQMNDDEIMMSMISQGQELLNQIGESEGLQEDIAHFSRLAPDLEWSGKANERQT